MVRYYYSFTIFYRLPLIGSFQYLYKKSKMKFSGRVCVCGAGTMGRGIAQVSAQSGFTTILYEPNEQVLRSAESGIFDQLEVLVKKGKMDQTKMETVRANLSFTNRLEDCRADLFIEAIIEDASVKIVFSIA